MFLAIQVGGQKGFIKANVDGASPYSSLHLELVIYFRHTF